MIHAITGQQRQKDISHITCFNCQEKGHYQSDCKNNKVERVFEEKSTPASKEKTAQVKMTVVSDEASESSGCSGYSEEEFDFCLNTIVHSVKNTKILCTTDGKIPIIWLLLDSEATENIFSSKKLVKNIRKATKGCRICWLCSF